jgi:hypothetical protein
MEDNKKLGGLNKGKKYKIKMKSTLSPDAFYNNFIRVTNVGRPSKIIYTNLVTDYIKALTDEMIYNNTEITFPFIGSFRVQERKCNYTTKDGSRLLKRRVDWKATHEMHLAKHPGLTLDEIYALPEKKKVLYFENEITGNCFYRILWRKNNVLKNRYLYSFKTSNTVRVKLVANLKDPNRKIQYYG